jgi:hypothetical protein
MAIASLAVPGGAPAEIVGYQLVVEGKNSYHYLQLNQSDYSPNPYQAASFVRRYGRHADF